jgi:hypothetical protein
LVCTANILGFESDIHIWYLISLLLSFIKLQVIAKNREFSSKQWKFRALFPLMAPMSLSLINLHVIYTEGRITGIIINCISQQVVQGIFFIWWYQIVVHGYNVLTRGKKLMLR